MLVGAGMLKFTRRQLMAMQIQSERLRTTLGGSKPYYALHCAPPAASLASGTHFASVRGFRGVGLICIYLG